MTVQIEEGKFYKTTSGMRVGPMKELTHAPGYFDAVNSYGIWVGWSGEEVAQDDLNSDIVSEWFDDAPVPGFTPQELDDISRGIGVYYAHKAEQQKNEPAWKMDAGKPRIDLIPPEFVSGTANVLAFGAAKYGERNWESGMSWGRCFGALMRHMWAWWSGERNDPESGLPHLAHAACCLAFLMAYENRQIGKDDRKAVDTSSEV